MKAIESRVQALEKAALVAEAADAFFIVPLQAGDSDAALVRIQEREQEWHIRPGESQAEFKGRAKAEVERRPREVPLLFGFTE